MTKNDTTVPRRRGGLADKRRAILSGALTVFARDGYTRASIDAISAEAGVSTRTVYNHFTDKAELFHAVIQESAGRAAEAQVAIIERHLSKVTDVEGHLVEFGRAWVTSMPEHAGHFALVRQINAEAGHIAQATFDAWQEAGPLRVKGELADRLRHLTDRKLLRMDDPDRAARHLLTLVWDAPPPRHGESAPGPQEITDNVTAGVRAFLYGYGS